MELLRHAKQSDRFSIGHSTIKNTPFHFAEYRLTGILNAHPWRQRRKPFLYLDCVNGAVTVEGNDKRGMELDVLGIICQHENPQNGILENDCTRGPVGGMGNNIRSSRCPAGQVVQGIVARSGLFVDGGIFLPRRDWFTVQKQPGFSNIAYCKAWTPYNLRMKI